MRIISLVPILMVLAIGATSTPAAAAECGDLDGSGVIVTTDSLAVLRRAIGLPNEAFECPACIQATTTSSECCYDECFNDEDCPKAGYPDHYVCGGEHNAFCVECRGDCDGTDECVNWQCINGCGDFNDRGGIAASDALMVLKKAVGHPVTLQCPGCEGEPPPTTTSVTIVDQCFNDQDCVEYDFGKDFCGGPTGHECVECDANDADCGAGKRCENYFCVPE